MNYYILNKRGFTIRIFSFTYFKQKKHRLYTIQYTVWCTLNTVHCKVPIKLIGYGFTLYNIEYIEHGAVYSLQNRLK